MRLVIQYTHGDGYTWSCENTVPVVYESAEDFAVDFEHWCKEFKDHSSLYGMNFAGQEFTPADFFEDGEYYPPGIMTVDDWFAEVENRGAKK